MEGKSINKSYNTQHLDINNPQFYENVQTEIESDLARMKKSVEVIMNLRLTAAEMEVETAALYHAELWYDLVNVQNNVDKHVEKEDNKIDGN